MIIKKNNSTCDLNGSVGPKKALMGMVSMIGFASIVFAASHHRTAETRSVAPPTSVSVSNGSNGIALETTSKPSVASRPAESGNDKRVTFFSKLDRVTKAINKAGNCDCIVMLHESGQGAFVGQDGIIRVDTSIAWQLPEDQLAALLAHEAAHVVLGHWLQFKELNQSSGLGETQRAEQMRDMELLADEWAGRILANAGYKAEGFANVLRRMKTTSWEDPSVRLYYSDHVRVRAFLQGYGQSIGSQPSE